MTGWQVDYTTPGFRKPDDPPDPEPEWPSEEMAEYAAACVRREEQGRHHW